MPKHRSSAELEAIAEVLKVLDLNGERTKGIIAQWMTMLHSEVLEYVEKMVKQIHNDNEVALRRLTGTLQSQVADEQALSWPPYENDVQAPNVPRHGCAWDPAPPPPTTPAPSACHIAAKVRAAKHGRRLAEEEPLPAPAMRSNGRSPMTPAAVDTRPGRCSVGPFHEEDTTDLWRNEIDQAPAGQHQATLRARKKSCVFVDEGDMREQVREALQKPSGPLAHQYHDEGLWQHIAKMPCFETFSLAVIVANVIWIAIDLDVNDEILLKESPAGFQVMEHMFCIYFCFEWYVRLMASKDRVALFRSFGFVYDTFLVFMAVLETWFLNLLVVPLLCLGQGSVGSDDPIVGVLRVVRMTRALRCIRIVRVCPSLALLAKGFWVASRSVLCTLVLLFAIIYTFALAFRQMTSGMNIGNKYFATVPGAIGSLVLRGTLPDLADLVYDVGEADVVVATLLFVFILVATVMVMTLLVGVFVQVVRVVSAFEREEMTASFVKARLCQLFSEEVKSGAGEARWQKAELLQLLTKDRCRCFVQECGVDHISLVEYTDVKFQDGEEIEIFTFVELILQLRSSNKATVKDLADNRKFLLQALRSCAGEIKAFVDQRMEAGDAAAPPAKPSYVPVEAGALVDMTPPHAARWESPSLFCNGGDAVATAPALGGGDFPLEPLSYVPRFTQLKPCRPPMVLHLPPEKEREFTPSRPGCPPTILHLPSEMERELWEDGEEV